jgi:hypothetical protein
MPNSALRLTRLTTERGKEIVRVNDMVVANAEVRALEKRIRKLELVLGKETLENEIPHMSSMRQFGLVFRSGARKEFERIAALSRSVQE